MQAIRSTRTAWSRVGRGATVLFPRPSPRWPCPVRRYLPQLIKLVLEGRINPGKVFDQVLPLDQVAVGYRAMDERRAIKTLLRP
jgi:threonine dehydrogenase-like Zn-dependent dehydrogenase